MMALGAVLFFSLLRALSFAAGRVDKILAWPAAVCCQQQAPFPSMWFLPLPVHAARPARPFRARYRLHPSPPHLGSSTSCRKQPKVKIGLRFGCLLWLTGGSKDTLMRAHPGSCAAGWGWQSSRLFGKNELITDYEFRFKSRHLYCPNSPYCN